MVYLVTGYYEDAVLEDSQFQIYGVFSSMEEASKIVCALKGKDSEYYWPESNMELYEITPLEIGIPTEGYRIAMMD